MEKINVAKLLRNCPSGMELDCTMWDNLYFDRVEDDLIHCYYELDGFRNTTMFLKDGCYTAHKLSKCAIFPKGKTTWEGFHRPFKDGDIIAFDSRGGAQLFIFKEYIYNNNYAQCYMMLDCDGAIDFEGGDYYVERFATEEEKQKLFASIKAHGYKWNPKTKTLEKLVEPQFKDGDIVTCKDGGLLVACIYKRKNTISFFNHHIALYKGCLGVLVNGEIALTDDKLRFATEEEKAKLFKAIKYKGYKWNEETKTLEKLPKFKNGDVITCENECCTFISIFKENTPKRNSFKGHCVFILDDSEFKIRDSISYFNEARFATKREKYLLFKAINDSGYKWNPKTKTLENLFSYNIGKKVWVKSDKERKYIHTIVGISRNSFGNLEYEVKEEKSGVVVHYPECLLIPVETKEPKFKVGDKIFDVLRKSMGALGTFQGVISEITDDKYIFTDGSYMFISRQDDYELVPNELEKLVKPEFKIGDIIQDIDAYKVKITEINIGDECYGYESIIAKGIGSIPFNEQGNWKLVEPEFKVWHKIKSIKTGNIYEIIKIVPNYYIAKYLGSDIMISWADQDKYELVQDKFDINTLVPYESRVLARDNEREKWIPAFWGFYDVNSDYPYKLIGCIARYCIPYEGNEHLRGKTDDCDKYFKTWE